MKIETKLIFKQVTTPEQMIEAKRLDDIIFPDDDFHLDTTSTKYWLCYDADGGLVSYCSVTDHADSLFLSRAGVLPEHRGNKYQRDMIAFREAYAQKEGYKMLTTYVMWYSIGSLKSLLMQGFKVMEPFPPTYGCPKIFLYKKLD